DVCEGQFDEQLRLIEAVSQTEAFIKATRLGKENEDQFDSEKDSKVKWLFIGVTDVNEMPEWQDGAELFYHIRETPDAEQYTRYILHRSALLSHQL
ncbi:MAG: DUF4288 domain-containing protein, partial [Mucilaginibacter polytrichastri]|nr:DUF4288 domain-containing protein [Mucilaginibacter polytrichastri]